MAQLIRKLISTAKAPRPVAPYNQAVAVDRTLYVSGVLGLDKDSMTLVPGGVGPETRQSLQSLTHILEAGNSSIDKVVKVTIFLKDMADFNTVNKIYSEFFTKDYPARCAYQVAALPLGAQVEIEAVAVCGDVKTVNAAVGCATCGPSSCVCKM